MRRYLPAAEMLMVIAGILGIVFWFSYWFLGYYYASIEVDPKNEISRLWFGFSIVMLLSSIICLYGSYYISTRNFKMAFFAALFGIFSYGYLIGSVLSAVSLFIIVHNAEEFEEGKERRRSAVTASARRSGGTARR